MYFLIFCSMVATYGGEGWSCLPPQRLLREDCLATARVMLQLVPSGKGRARCVRAKT